MADLAFLRERADLGAPYPALRPQSLLLSFLGELVDVEHEAVASSTCLAVFDSLGVSRHSARSTLTRAERHDLRCRLRWASFFLLQAGVWVAPRRADARPIIHDLSGSANVQVFYGKPANPIDLDALIDRAYDVRALQAGYERFVERWDRADPLPQAGSDLARFLLLSTEWQLLLRDSPRVPAEHLPAAPSVRAAERAYWQRRDELAPTARLLVTEVLDTISASPVAGPAVDGSDRIGHGHARTSWG